MAMSNLRPCAAVVRIRRCSTRIDPWISLLRGAKINLPLRERIGAWGVGVNADAMEIDGRIDRFRRDLLTLDTRVMVQKHIAYGDCFILNPEGYFDLKLEVANTFSVNPAEILVVGSGKLGFSIAPAKRYKHFGDTSDIDVAIVSTELFQRVWLEVFEFVNDANFWPEKAQFQDYLLMGWIRPDKRGGLYHSWQFLESYHAVAIRHCREQEQLKL
jgi:hypothetical protein